MLSDLIGYIYEIFIPNILKVLITIFGLGLVMPVPKSQGTYCQNTLIDKISTKNQSRMRGFFPPFLIKCGFTDHEFLDKTVHENIYNQMSAYAFEISSNLCTQLPF
jgi:hypothetical protein